MTTGGVVGACLSVPSMALPAQGPSAPACLSLAQWARSWRSRNGSQGAIHGGEGRHRGSVLRPSLQHWANAGSDSGSQRHRRPPHRQGGGKGTHPIPGHIRRLRTVGRGKGVTSPNQGLSLDPYPKAATRAWALSAGSTDTVWTELSSLQRSTLGANPQAGRCSIPQGVLRNAASVDVVAGRPSVAVVVGWSG